MECYLINNFREYLLYKIYKKKNKIESFIVFKNSSGVLKHKLYKKHLAQDKKLKFRTYRCSKNSKLYWDYIVNFRTRKKYPTNTNRSYNKINWLNARQKIN